MKEDNFACLAIHFSVGWAVVRDGKDISCGWVDAALDVHEDFESYLRKEMFGTAGLMPLYYTFLPRFCLDRWEADQNAISKVFDVETGVPALKVNPYVVKSFVTGPLRTGEGELFRCLAERFELYPADTEEAMALALALFAIERRKKLAM